MDINEIASIKKDVSILQPPRNSIIYFLFKNDEIVYVGQSKTGTNRIWQHTRNDRYIDKKDFNFYSFIPCEENTLNETEAYYIIKFKPKYNKSIPKNNKYVNINKCCSPSAAKKILSHAKCSYFKLQKEAAYMDIDDFYDLFRNEFKRDYITQNYVAYEGI
jgi:excinuclease UvrABC nuclease subunit